ncbi:MAG: carbohydrate ABC transporter permease [Pikeienuella sp.]
MRPTPNGLATALLLAPATLLFAALALYPLSRVLALSTVQTDYGFDGAVFIGWDNYAWLFETSGFRTAGWNTLVFALSATAAEVTLGLALALLFAGPVPGRRILIALLLAPYVLATLVVTAIWRAWFHFELGFLNGWMAELGLAPVRWLIDPDLALWSLVLVDLWQTAPFAFLILLAGLQSIPRELIDAARVDCASRFAIFRDITLPLMMPYILLAALLRLVDSFKIFDKVYALTGGGPGRATETLSMHVYRLGFKFFDIGLASAASVVMIALAGVLALVSARGLLAEGRR